MQKGNQKKERIEINHKYSNEYFKYKVDGSDIDPSLHHNIISTYI